MAGSFFHLGESITDIGVIKIRVQKSSIKIKSAMVWHQKKHQDLH